MDEPYPEHRRLTGNRAYDGRSSSRACTIARSRRRDHGTRRWPRRSATTGIQSPPFMLRASRWCCSGCGTTAAVIRFSPLMRLPAAPLCSPSASARYWWRGNAARGAKTRTETFFRSRLRRHHLCLRASAEQAQRPSPAAGGHYFFPPSGHLSLCSYISSVISLTTSCRGSILLGRRQSAKLPVTPS